MTETTLTLRENPVEYKNLKMVADCLTAMTPDNLRYILDDCYLDFGSNWMWTTIIKIDYNETGVLRRCQAVSSREWKEIVSARSAEKILDLVKAILTK